MTGLVLAFFYIAMAIYVAAAAVALSYLMWGGEKILPLAKRLSGMANTALLIVFVLRTMQWGLVPLTGLTDSLNLFLVLATGIMLSIQRKETCRSLLSFYLPPLGLIAVLNALSGYGHLSESPMPLNGIPLILHVGLVFLAFALFFVASMTSMAYAFQAQRLKKNQTTGIFQRLPSLEQLDKTLYHLISIGYPVFVTTLVVGLSWAWFDRDLLGERWWLSPKIFLSAVMVAFYSTSFHGRRIGWLRGPKLAYIVFFGFTSLLVVYIALGLLQLGDYNFWDAST